MAGSSDQFEVEMPQFEVTAPDGTPYVRPEVQKAIQSVPRPTFKPPAAQGVVERAVAPNVDQAAGFKPEAAPGSFEGHPENIGEYVPQSAGKVVSGVSKLAEAGVLPGSSYYVPPAPVPSEEQTRKAASGFSDIISGAGNALAPTIPFTAAAAPVTVATGFGVGKGAEYLTHKLTDGKVSPEVQDLLENLAFWMPGVAGHLLGARAGIQSSPEGTAASVSMRGGTGAGVAVTPEDIRIRAGIGSRRFEKIIPRNGNSGQSAIEPQTIEGQQVSTDPASQALAQHEVIQARAARVAQGKPPVEPPPAPPTPKVTQITPEQVAHVGEMIQKLPPELRAQGMLEAHQTMARILEQSGKVIGPNGKLLVIDSPKAAEKAAADIVNGEVERLDKLTTTSAKPTPKSAGTEGTAQPKAEAAPATPRKTGRQRAQEIAAQAAPKFEVTAPEPKFEVEHPTEQKVGLPNEEHREVAERQLSTETGKPQSGGTGETGEHKPSVPAESQGSEAVGPDGLSASVSGGGSERTAIAAGNSALSTPEVSKAGFQKGQQVRFSKPFEVRKGPNKEVAETVPQGTTAFIEHAGEGMNFVRLRLPDGRKLSVNQRALEQMPEGEKPFKHRSTQVNIPEGSEAHQALDAARQRIADSDLAGNGKDIGGNHVTVRWGLKAADDDKLEKMKKYLSSLSPFEASLGKTEKFEPSESSEGAAVIQAPIEAKELKQIHDELGKHADFKEPTFSEYKPHATVAYVNPEKADRYVGMSVTHGKKFKVNSIAITDRHGKQEEVPLKGELPSNLTKAKLEEKRALSLELTHPPADIGIKQYIDALPEHQQQYAKDLWDWHQRGAGEGDGEMTPALPTGVSEEEADKIDAHFHSLQKTTRASGPEALANEVYKKLNAGESLGKVDQLTKLAEEHLGAGRVSGKWTPKDMFDAMEAGVNKYLIEHGKELMEMDAIDGLAELKKLEQRLTSQGTRTEEQITHQQFSTPPRESYVAAKVAGLKSSDVVLEPSAGNGGLAVWPKSIGAKVHVNEIAPRRQAMLRAAGFGEPTAVDGELINTMLDKEIKPTVVLMNPPFSAGATKSYAAKNTNQYGFNHVDQALQRLEDGGRLVAILGGGRADDAEGGASLFGKESSKWFESVARKYNVRANIRVNGKEYQKYGTNFATRIIVIDKDGPTPSQVAKDAIKSWDSVIRGNADTLEEAYNLLRGVAESRPDVTREANPPSRSERVAVSRTGETQPATGVAGTAGPRSASDRGAIREGGTTRAENELAGRPAGSANVSGEPAPGGVAERFPLRESGLPAERHAEARPAEGARSSAENAAGERPLPGATEQPLTGAETSDAGLELTKDKHAIAEQEEEDSAAYVTYRPTLAGPKHPGVIVETKTMSTVPMPEITYKPKLPDSILKEGRLSAVQLEAVGIAGHQNSIVLPGGARASALIGDGTGVGKGREGASILFDNWRQGRKRLVWVSEKWDLMQDAIRDLKGIGADDLVKTVKPFAKCQATAPIEHEGVLFTTYALIRSADKKGNTRVSQLKQWLQGKDDAEGAYILYDESHNLKNAVAENALQVSQIGKAVKEDLMAKLPKLRSVSLSATAATDVMNLGYLDRLGLWGPGTAFPNGFMEFANQIGAGGMSAMEMVARELKAQGKYVSRTLSFKGVTYREVEHPLNDEQKELYRTAAKAWKQISSSVEATIRDTTKGGGLQKARAMSQFYSAQQRFFNVLITTLKVPSAIAEAHKGLAEGKSIVITLVNTNEAAQNREKNRFRESADPDEVPEYDFGPKEMLVDMVREHYPTQQYRDDVDSQGNRIQVPVTRTDAEGREIPVENPEAAKERNRLLAELNKNLHMPQNPLDLLIDGLGGPSKVAELTGRKERFDPASAKFVPRGGKDVKRDEINLSEMRAYQAGKKRIAVLSSAAGTGISLHAGNDVQNQQPRLHITLQVGWSADKQMQMFGRTHRTNQAHAPEYVMLTSDLGGEKRFVSTIARRLGSLGALSKGQKNATTGSDLMEKVNFETEQGKQATSAFFTTLLRRGFTVPGTKLEGMQVLEDMGVLRSEAGGGKTVPPADRQNVTRMLNRMLSLDPDIQNAVYNYYYDIFQATVQAAIDNGTLDTGVKTLPGDEFKVKEERAIAKDPKTGAETFYYPVDVSLRAERISPKQLDKMLAKKKDDPRLMYRAPYKSDEGEGKIALMTNAPPIVHADGTVDKAVYLYYPNSGRGEKVAESRLYRWKEVGEHGKEELQKAKDEVENQRYYLSSAQNSASRYADQWAQDRLKAAQEKYDAAEKKLKEAESATEDPMEWGKSLWNEAFEKAPSHNVQEHHFVGGAVMRYWNAIHEASGQRLNIYTTTDSTTGKRIVGVDIPADHIRQLLDRITGGKSTVNAHQLLADVLNNNLSYDLETGIQVKPGRVAREKVVQFVPPNQDVATNLKRLGIIYEKGLTPVYYLPMGEDRWDDKPKKILENILKEYPVKAEESKPAVTGEGEEPQTIPGESLGEHLKGESGSFEPGKIADAAKTVKDFLKQELEDNHRARELQWQMYDLDKMHTGRVLQARHLLEQLQEKGVTQDDRRAIDDHLDALEADSDSVPVPPLTPFQDEILDRVLLPIKEEAEAAFKKVTEGGLTIPNYNPRQTKGKGGYLDRVMSKYGQKWTGRANLLSQNMPASKHRVMMAIENEAGDRHVVSIKKGKATMWQDGQPTELGEVRNAKGNGKTENETFPEGEPNSYFYDKGMVVEGPDGYDWKIVGATKNEIEKNSGVEYYHDAAASAIVNWLQAKKAEAAYDLVEGLKKDPDFKNIAMQTGKGNPPNGWRTTNLPQFKGYYFEPHTAEVLDWFFDRLKSGDSEAFQNINRYMRVKILLNPIKHPLNITAQWALEKGVTGFLPNKWVTIAKTGSRAISAVVNQNDDLVAAYKAGFPGQAAHEATRDLVKLFYEQMADAAEKGEPWSTKAARALAFPPKALVEALHGLASKIAWPVSDILFLQSAYQYQAEHSGVSLNDAFREVGKIIPEYRLPVRIMNSKTLGKLMSSPVATLFGSYHYGLLRSFAESAKAAMGGEPGAGQSKAESTGKGWDRLMLLAAGAFLLYAALDKMAQEITGDKDATVRRHGIFGLIDAAMRVARKEEKPTQAMTRVLTPNPATEGIAQLFFDRDFQTGHMIYDPAAKWQTEREQLLHYLIQQATPMGSEIERAQQTDKGWQKFAWNQGDVNFPKHGAAALAQQIASTKYGSAPMTDQERDKYAARQKAIEGLRRGDDTAIEEARAKGLFNATEARELHKRARKSDIEDKVREFTVDELREVHDRAVSDGDHDTAEKLARMMRQKRRERLARHLERFDTEAETAVQ